MGFDFSVNLPQRFNLFHVTGLFQYPPVNNQIDSVLFCCIQGVWKETSSIKLVSRDYVRRFAPFGTICAIKTWKTPMEEWYIYLSCRLQSATLLKVKLFCGFFFHVFQIVQTVLNRAKHHICNLLRTSFILINAKCRIKCQKASSVLLVLWLSLSMN